MLAHLVELVIPNVDRMPNFNPKEIQHWFASLGYPYSIRADAITAVGAPSSIAFLARALYWLYLVVRGVFYRQAGAILEAESADERGEGASSADGDNLNGENAQVSRTETDDSVVQ